MEIIEPIFNSQVCKHKNLQNAIYLTNPSLHIGTELIELAKKFKLICHYQNIIIFSQCGKVNQKYKMTTLWLKSTNLQIQIAITWAKYKQLLNDLFHTFGFKIEHNVISILQLTLPNQQIYKFRCIHQTNFLHFFKTQKMQGKSINLIFMAFLKLSLFVNLLLFKILADKFRNQ